MHDNPHDERITELESRLEFQDEIIAKLNDALVTQQHRFFELEKTVAMLLKALREKDFAPMPGGDERPPHY